MKRRYWILAALLLPVLAFGQTFTVFNADNSDLPYNGLYCIAFDNQNNVWFGGQDDAATGLANVSMLSRDGSAWTVYDAQTADLGLDALEDRVYYIATDDQNTLWMATHYGISYRRADGTAGAVDFTVDEYTRAVQTDSKGNVYISMRDGADRNNARLHVSSDHGATWAQWSMADMGFTQTEADARPEVYDLYEDAKGQLWACTWYGVSYRDMAGDWHVIADIEGEYTYAMTVDPNDHVWVADNGNLNLYEIVGGVVTTHDSTSIEPLKYAVVDLESDCYGHLWCALDGGGLLEIKPDGSFKQYTAASTGGDLPSDNLQDLEIHCGVIWTTTTDAGVVKIEGLIDSGDNALFTSDNSDLPYNGLYCIAFDNQNNVWFGGQDDAATGLANVSMLSRDGSAWTVYDAQTADLGLDALEDRVYYIATDDQNTLWMATHYGISYRKADGTAGAVDFTVDEYTRAVQTDSKGNVYISMRDGADRNNARLHVSSDHGATWAQWSMADMGFTQTEADARPEVYDLYEDSKGQLWVCTWYGVSYRDMAGDWHVVSDIEGEYTYAMTVDPNDHVWVADNGNLNLYEISGGVVTTHDSTSIEPLKYAVVDLESDCYGHLWCALDGGGLLEIKPDGSFEQYTAASSNGMLPSDNLQDLEIHCGVIWATTTDAGVVRLAGPIGATTAVENDDALAPQGFGLYANYPNPFNPVTEIRYEAKQAEEVEITVYDLRGRRIKVLKEGLTPQGTHAVKWDATDENGNTVPSGVYIYQLRAGKRVISRKMMLLK